MNISIRRGEAGDALAVSVIAARTFYDTFAAGTRPDDMALHLADAYGEEQQRRELLDPEITTLLLEIDELLAGFAMLRPGSTPDCVTGPAPQELWRFYIDKPWHGRGAAPALMQRVQSEAVSRGAQTLWLGVWEHNERAKAFYAKNGFKDAGSHVYTVGTEEQTDRIMVRPLGVSASVLGQ